MGESKLSENPAHALSQPGTILLVLMSNPPSTTTGDRTRRRVELLQTLVGIEETVTANLFSIPTYRTGEISEAGVDADGWLDARPAIVDAMDRCTAVMLAYGGQEPAGQARMHFREQISWAEKLIDARNLPVWTVGGRPLHPSRWHRFTHSNYPEVPFHDALVRSVKRRPMQA
ncbi:DUF1643 domain-containing protein [Agreia pratensis]|uniref:DUF1643 domain-containing protein n=1 Tax=Agreia pratensis TaxID=150121 RepID=A0A1X7KUD8_9MICO|nr:DUF1643 domain-containing protein [Agreia pratensis]SMG44516.1 Protein of unknown function [Agreia pratensis]